ncbi:hypothetical protein CRENBAI_025936 [Crenichthys baileyi]|uniref:Uncharacterized protein n=1 Tax=Crenichthys baileyi TaxID=28760 RepID=A0AAV9RCI4_9TELE
MENQTDRMLIGRPGDAQKSHWKVEVVKHRKSQEKPPGDYRNPPREEQWRVPGSHPAATVQKPQGKLQRRAHRPQTGSRHSPRKKIQPWKPQRPKTPGNMPPPKTEARQSPGVQAPAGTPPGVSQHTPKHPTPGPREPKK